MKIKSQKITQMVVSNRLKDLRLLLVIVHFKQKKNIFICYKEYYRRTNKYFKIYLRININRQK